METIAPGSGITLADLVETGESAVLLDKRGDPVGRYTPASEILTQRAQDGFLFLPHDPSDCLGTCWRHNGSVADGAVPARMGSKAGSIAPAGKK